MAMNENRRPLFSKDLEKVSWRPYGKRIRIDPSLDSLTSYSVYRYASIAEALSLCSGTITFASPHAWPDKYEKHLVDTLFSGTGPFSHAVPYVKCFSLEYSSEAMWRTYSGPGGLVRIGLKLSDLINELDRAKWPTDAKIYIGRVRYMEEKQIRTEINGLLEESQKRSMNVAMPALLMKRAGFSFENEVRVAFLPKASERQPVISARGFSVRKVSRMLLDPYLPTWQTDELRDLFKLKLKFPFDVRRSSFDAHPGELTS